MTTTELLLDAAKKAAGVESDYGFAQKFGFSRSRVSSWRHGVSLDDNAAEILAEILGREPAEVMALCQAERAKDEKSRSRWIRAAALIAAAVATPAAHSMDLSTSGTTSHNSAKGIDIMSSRRRRLSVALAGIFGPGSLQIAI